MEKKKRKLVLCIEPGNVIKKNLREAAFMQILENISKFKAFEKEKEDQLELQSDEHCIVLHDLKNERKVLEIIQRFNFKIVSD